VIAHRQPIAANWNPIIWVILNAAVSLYMAKVGPKFEWIHDCIDKDLPAELRTAPWERIVMDPALALAVGVALVLVTALSMALIRDRVRANRIGMRAFTAGWGLFSVVFMYAAAFSTLAW
jgi:hypothetical protein